MASEFHIEKLFGVLSDAAKKNPDLRNQENFKSLVIAALDNEFIDRLEARMILKIKTDDPIIGAKRGAPLVKKENVAISKACKHIWNSFGLPCVINNVTKTEEGWTVEVTIPHLPWPAKAKKTVKMSHDFELLGP